MIDELPHHKSFHQVDVVMEGSANLRPQLLGKLLRECKSVKVKRLFWYADRHGHTWFKHLDQSSVDLGKGKCQLVPQGHFDSRYQITLPVELFNAGGTTMASEVFEAQVTPFRSCTAIRRGRDLLRSQGWYSNQPFCTS
jgi:hypothetical protein